MLLAAASLLGLGDAVRKVAPEFRSWALLVPPLRSRLTTRAVRAATRVAARGQRVPAGIGSTERTIELPGAPPVQILIVEREHHAPKRPALLWLHGGGYVAGLPEMDLPLLARIVEAIDVAVVSVDYRLAPEQPFPAGLNDAWLALRWLTDHVSDLGIDPHRLAVGGNSAGGGLAAALVQRARDQATVQPVFQLLLYPMLDDRTVVHADRQGRGELVWTPKSNRFAWRAYLGMAPGSETVPRYSAPGRREGLEGLPPSWIAVGSLDLFHDEDLDYARRLGEAGVPCTINRIEGAPHGFDITSFDAPATRAFHQRMTHALAHGLSIAPG
jgi:acetyl esterase/lipase